jgi:exonuclease VII small subunit
MSKSTPNITDIMQELRTITEWFDAQDELDVEQGIEKMRHGAELIKKGRSRLEALENVFEEIRKDLETKD